MKKATLKLAPFSLITALCVLIVRCETAPRYTLDEKIKAEFGTIGVVGYRFPPNVNVNFGLLTYLPLFLIWLAVISGCSSTGIKDKSQLMPDEMLSGADGVVSLDTVTEEPMFEEATSDSYKLSKTPSSKILNMFGEGIKYTLDVLVESVKGVIVGGAAGVVVGGVYPCLEALPYPPIYLTCVASMGVVGSGIGLYSALTEPHDTLFKTDTLFKSERNIPTCNVYYCQPGSCGSSQFRISKLTGNLNSDSLKELNEILERSNPEKTHHNCPM